MDEISKETGQDAPPPAEQTDWRDRGGWRHPYVLYVLGTAILFLFLILMAYLALESGWIPDRGVSSH